MTTEETPTTAVLDAARLMLAQMGISPADLLALAPVKPSVPTFAEYVPVVSRAARGHTRRTYDNYWNRIIAHWGDRRLDEPTPSEIKELPSTSQTPPLAGLEAGLSRLAWTRKVGWRWVSRWNMVMLSAGVASKAARTKGTRRYRVR